MSKNIIQLNKVCRCYETGSSQVRALANINLTVSQGELVVIKGPSGSGKSTLLHIIGLLDKPTQGSYFLTGKLVDRRTKSKTLARLRLTKIGFIFQTFNLIPRMSALANVELPMIYGRLKSRRQKALKLLKLVGLSKRIRHHPNSLSGGERQRVAIARALANDPEIILADEPTGNLDSKTGRQILKVLAKLHQQGKTIIVVTHDEAISRIGQRIIYLKDGKITKSL